MKTKGIHLVSTVGCVLLFSACSGSPTPVAVVAPVTSAVNVIVTGDADVSAAFANDVRNGVLRSIVHYVPHARPMTVALSFDTAASGVTVSASSYNPREVRTLGTSTNAATVGALPTVEVHPVSIAGWRAETAYRLNGNYVITDPAGRILESRPFAISAAIGNGPNGGGEFGVRRDLATRAGDLVAGRVKALSH